MTPNDTERPPPTPTDRPPHLPTEGMYPLNELLAVVYPDLAPYPCAECCKAQGDRVRHDAHDAMGLVCARCAELPSAELDFTLNANEREAIRLFAQENLGHIKIEVR